MDLLRTHIQTPRKRMLLSSFYSRSNFSLNINWKNLPLEVVLHIFEYLTVEDQAKAAMVCRSWHEVFHFPRLWRSFEFIFSSPSRSYLRPTSPELIEYILKYHRQSLKFVIFKVDSTVEAAENACRILSKLVNCSLKTLRLTSSAHHSFNQMDPRAFLSALTMVFHGLHCLSTLAIDDTPVDDSSLHLLFSNNSDTLEILKIKSCPRVSRQGILSLAVNCHCLRELALNYSLLTDSLLLTLSSNEHACLEHLHLDVSSDEDLQNRLVTPSCWRKLTTRSPKLNLVMYFYFIREEVFDHFFQCEIPVTHLYFVDYVSKSVLQRIGQFCPRLIELVVGANGNCASIDNEMLNIAHNCRNLVSLGLGECEVSCSAFIELVRICSPHLKELSVMEEALLEDDQHDVNDACEEVSRYLGRDWTPEVMPVW